MEAIQVAYQGFAKQNYTMLDNLKLGYGGTKTEMERLLKDAQKITGIKYDINNLNDVFQAIHIIQNELDITGTTAKEASTTIEGSVNSMKAAWTNLLTGLGADTLNFDDLMNEFVESVIIVFNNLLPRIKLIMQGIVSLAYELLPQLIKLIGSMLPDIIDGIKYLIQGLAEALPNLLQILLETIITFSPTFVSTGITLIKSLIEGLISSLPKISSAVAEIIPIIVQALKDGIPELVKGAKELFSAMLGAIPEVLDSLKNELGDVLPYIEAIGVAFLSWKIGSTIQSAVKGFQEAKLALSLFSLETNGATIAQGLFNGSLSLGETLVGLFTGKVTLAQIASTGLAKAQTVLNAVMNANPIMLIVLAIGALIGIFIVLWNKCEGFRNFWIGLWNIIKETFSVAKDFVIEKFQEIVDFITNIPNKFEEFKETILELFKNTWQEIITFFTEGIPNFINSILEWLSELPYNIGFIIGSILGNIIQFGLNLSNWITTELPLLIEGIIEWFSQLPEKIWVFLLDIINKIINWGTQSYENAKIWVANLITTVVQFFSELPKKVWTWLANVISKIVQWGKDLENKGRDAASNLVTTVYNKLEELPGKVVQVGRNIVEGLWNGIVGAKDWIFNKVSEFATGILDGMKNALGIHSPSTLFRDEVGKFIPAGVAVGVDANTEEARKAIKNMNAEIMKEMSKAVAFETGTVNAKATLDVNKEKPIVIARDQTFNVENTQNFYNKETTPYEQQKQAKEQLKDLAWQLS